jgi:Na+-transporting NADH:ubiquinone oxidoreductase subunit C
MNRNSNTYIFLFSVIMVIVVGAVLSFVAISLKPMQKKNIEVEKKRNILSALQIENTVEDAQELFDSYITEMIAINTTGDIVPDVDVFELDLKKELYKEPKDMHLPVFIGKLDNGELKYIIPLSGKGLWGPIWGYIALNEDMTTVFGATFSHKSETPGLGAEIETDWYQAYFSGKRIFNENGEFVSIQILKGGAAPDNDYGVDAISGGTITSNGLEDMIFDCLKLYEPYLKNN